MNLPPSLKLPRLVQNAGQLQVHGGEWKIVDKALESTLENSRDYWMRVERPIKVSERTLDFVLSRAKCPIVNLGERVYAP